MAAGAHPRPGADAVAGLHGRDAELAEVHRLLHSAPRSVVVRGEPGAGKSALLAAAADVASTERWVVLRTGGDIADRELPFAAISALLVTAPAGGSRVHRDLHAGLLAHIRGGDPATATTPLGLRLDLLAWLEGVSERQPLLVVVDDAQWVDRTSLQVLAFLARRVAALPVSFLFATRTDRPSDELAGFPEIPLRGLGPDDAARIVLAALPDIGSDRLAAVLERSEGNPLALLEFARALPDAPLDGSSVPLRVQQAFASDLPKLPELTLTVLLLAAAGTDDVAVLARVAGPDRLPAALEPAEQAGLIRVQDHTVRFRHPLARQAVYSAATTAERVRAHRALADAYAEEPDRRAWHRAAAALEPDEAVADELVAAARRAIDRVAYPEAARALRRSAELTADPRARELRLIHFLQIAVPTGQTPSHVDLYRQVRDETADPTVRAIAQQYVAYALTQTMEQAAARLALEDAVRSSFDAGDAEVWPSMTSLAVLLYQTADDPTSLLGWVERLGRSVDENPLITASRIWIRASAEPIARPPDLLAEVERAEASPVGTPPVVVGLRAMLLGSAAWLLDLPDVAIARLREARGILERANSQEFLPTLVALAQVCTDQAALDDAEEAARILYEIADAQRLDYQRAVAQHTRAAVAALRGDGAEARRIVESVRTELDLASSVALEVGLRLAVADSWFGVDDLARWREPRAVFAADGTPRHGRLSIRALVPAISTALRCGREQDARDLLAAVAPTIPAPAGAYQRLVLTTATALLADDDEADALFLAVVDDPASAQWPFETANARLEYGRRLRGRRRPVEAQAQLGPALQTFERLGTAPWVAAAKREQRDAGGATTATDSSTWSSLTPQERQVVRMAARGGTNREIGEALFLSPRTVGAHLYNAFPKLGVATRRQLREVVDRFDR